MSPLPAAHERSLQLFEAFLSHMRQSGTPAARATAPPPSHKGNEPTRETALPELLAGRMAAGPHWTAPPEGTDPGSPRKPRSIPPPPPPAAAPARDEGSIIIDQGAFTPEGAGSSGSDPGPPPGTVQVPPPSPGSILGRQPRDKRAEIFMREMLVLDKYGHRAQVPKEIDTFLRQSPEDLILRFRLADFAAARVNLQLALELFYTLASRAIEQGDIPLAREVLDRVELLSPRDLGVMALRDRLARY